jgi:hypothetical protein
LKESHTVSAADTISETDRRTSPSNSAEEKNPQWTPEVPPVAAPKRRMQLKTKKDNLARDTQNSSMEESVLRDNTQKTQANEEKEVSESVPSEEKKEIGSWGEEYVFECLKDEFMNKYPTGKQNSTEDCFTIIREEKPVVTVKWLNKYEDRKEPYDIIVTDENGVKEYIEVKTTITDNEEWFDVSQNQWEFIQKMGEKFHIYRVYNAGTDKAAYFVLDNPKQLWLAGELTATPVRIKLPSLREYQKKFYL